jgi:predicted ribosomally synthesized peptide with nif11-like leader
MSEEQLSVFWAVFQADPGLLDKLNVATDLDAALTIASEAGLDMSAEDSRTYLSSPASCNGEDFAGISGGKGHISLASEQSIEIRSQNKRNTFVIE